MHTNHPQGVTLGSHPAFPWEYPKRGGSLRVWKMCYGKEGISYRVRGVMVCCVSPNLRTCPISEGINGVKATSQDLQVQPWCFKEGKSNPLLSEPIQGKGEGEIHKK